MPELNMETVLSPAFCAIWDNSLMGVLIIDSNGLVRYINRLLIRTDDLQDETVLGRKMVDFYPMERDRHISIQTLKTGQPQIKKTIVYYTRKKKLVNSLCSTFPLVSNGNVEGVIHFSLNLQTSQALLEQYQTGAPDKTARPPEEKPYTFDSLIGRDPRFQHAVNQARSASHALFTVLIWAETGCAKVLFAQAIHQASLRASHAFIPVNCAAIPDNLLETTLFGTARGAFTGAVDKAGLLEEAQGGTLLLDELNSMSLELQAKLLRVVQEKKVRRVGALKEIPVDVNFISTCNIPPSQAMDQGKIRADLFYRLAVVVLEIPPLRQRQSDIPLLCGHFLEKLSLPSHPGYSSGAITLSSRVIDIFNQYPWPGNVRELEHTLKAATAILGQPGMITPGHLSDYFINNVKKFAETGKTSFASETGPDFFPENTPGMATGLPDPGLAESGTIDLAGTLTSLETLYVQKALIRAGYNISKAGRFLSLSPQALRYKISKLGIQVPKE
ncbi:MAG: sigma 54-interacting transcriptional regulator [Desulfotignum sp.]|nr:sigma 54-interacting transcriptional regulator [Desulfotignum sp.]